MTPLSVAAIGWLIGSLVSKAVTEVLEAWANRNRLGKEFKTLKDQLLQLNALLTSTHSLHTNNDFLKDLVDNLQQLAYKAENLLDELDYYRLKHEIQQKGNQDKVNCSNKSLVRPWASSSKIKKSLVASSSSDHHLASRPFSSTLEGLYVRFAPYAPVPLPKTSRSQINLSRRMKELAKELQKYEEKVRNTLETEASVNNSRKIEATNLPQTSPFHTETREVVGRNKERDELLLNLTNEESATVGKVLVLAIVGCGGVGKTTLAGLVYNDPKVKKYFDISSWICVSTRFDIVRFTREMLEAACDNRYDGLSNLEVLQKKLKDKLESKKFLLVLDDMWEDEDKSQWDKIIALLSNCMVKRAIILVTTRNKSVAKMVTRNESVAKMVDARDNTTYLEGLDNDVFLSFFSTCIFNDPNFGGNWRLRDIGQQIANKLKGNPLAAKTVSALLKKNSDERYWMKIRDSEEWKSQNGPNDIMPALRLSYEHMPFHLQRCFSYCAIFPEDYPFTHEELVYLWMAQGFLDVRSKGNRMEDIGSAYFNDMFDRGFFQTTQSTYYGEVCYTFHDLIRDLACVVSFKECLCINGAETKEIPQTIRHLSIFNSTKKAKSEEEIVPALECLEGENLGTVFNWDMLPSRSILNLLKKTKFLRALRLDLCGPVQLHNCNFQNFVSLRYLRLIMSDFDNCKTLPREICRLYHLEVLEIKNGRKNGRLLNELPNNFSDLVSLRHFIVEEKLHSKILGVGKLTSLQELNYFHVQQDSGFEIEQLGSLKEIGGSLEIWGLENVKSQEEANKARLVEKGRLDALYLEWNHAEQGNESVLEGLKPSTNLKSISIRGYGGVASPRWLDPSLIFLEALTLDCCFSCELLPPIGELESLKRLKLSRLAVREIGPQSMKFPSLEELKIKKMPHLQKWVLSDQLQQFLCFKKLKKLTIRDCPGLRDLPLSGSATSEVLERFPSLESLEIRDCPLIIELPPIGELESLKHLKLPRLAVREIGPQSMKFPSLEKLKIKKMPHLKKWVLSDQLQQFLCFKKLKKLTIRDCPGLGDLPLSGSTTSEVLERFPSLESLEIEDCPILELPPLPCSSLLSFIIIKRTRFIESMVYRKAKQDLRLYPNVDLALGELLAFHELTSLHSLTILYKFPSLESFHELSCLHSLTIYYLESFHENLNIPHLRSLEISLSSLESLDLHSFVALTDLEITGCESLTSLTFGDQMVCLTNLKIISCNALSSIKGLKSWVNLETLHFCRCPGFIPAWDSASKEIERTKRDFSLSLKIIECDFLAPLTLLICKQLTYLQTFITFSEVREVFPQLLTSVDLVDIEGCKKKNLQSFPFNLFPSLEELEIRFYNINSLPTSSYTEITDEFKKATNIKGVIRYNPLTIRLKLRHVDPAEMELSMRMMRMRMGMKTICEDDYVY